MTEEKDSAATLVGLDSKTRGRLVSTDKNGTTEVGRRLAFKRDLPGKVSVACLTEDRSQSYFIFGPEDPIRKVCVILSENRYFEKLIFLAVTFTAITVFASSLGVENDAFNIIEIMCFLVFVVELLLKTIAYGFFGYLNAPMPFLDLLCTLSMFLTLFPTIEEATGLSSLKVLRVLRSLQPLRALKTSQSLQVVVATLYKSLQKMDGMLAICVFMFLVFGIVGVQLFKGLLHYRCIPSGMSYDDFSFEDQYKLRICKVPTFNSLTAAYACEEEEVCTFVDRNPAGGTVSFDNLALAIYTVFQSMTLEGWVDILYVMQDAMGYLTTVYCVSLVMVGSYVVVNLALAVIYDSYIICKEEDRLRRLAEKELEDYFAELLIQGVIDPDADVFNINVQDKKRMDIMELISSNWKGLAPSMNNFVYGRRTSAIVIKDEKETSILVKVWSVGKQLIPIVVHSVEKRLSSLMRISFRSKTTDRISEKCGILLENDWFQRLILGLVFINFIFLCADHYNAPPELNATLSYLSYINLAVFGGEAILMIFYKGLWSYLTVWHTLTDFLVVILAILEVALEDQLGGAVAFRILRLTRILRGYRIYNHYEWQAMTHLLRAMQAMPAMLGSFGILTALYIFLVASVGVTLYGGKLDGSDNPRISYDDFFWSVVMSMQIMTGEDWPTVFVYVKSKTGWLPAMFILLTFVLGNLVFYNILVAILIDAFTHERDRDETEEAAAWVEAVEHSSGSEDEMEPDDDDEVPAKAPSIELKDAETALEADATEKENADSTKQFRRSIEVVSDSYALHGKSFKIFEVNHPFRKWLQRLVNTQTFDNCVMGLIAISSILLALNHPDLDESSQLAQVLYYSNFIFTAIFTLEMLVKMVVMQAFVGQNCYLSNTWNRLDFFVVIASIMSICLPKINFLNTCRAVRPLRFLVRVKGLQVLPHAHRDPLQGSQMLHARGHAGLHA
ncbi:hypothetical protein CYMTET_20228 [Cymbomonas tetramitiformis]|uniref:Ion transport domain-containing protein n=1 Tax=Cymbomonas tetramitiformis TaxID=36881 RepID=A0AAE0G4H9_9CHLO|nr:hypothetical protein CYMTET_20228 [Cymbomonas tetramitiformis]